MQRKTKIVSIITILGVALDQLTKLWIVRNLCHRQRGVRCELPESIEVFDGWFQLVHVQNPGAAFGMLNNFEYRMMVFYVFTAIAIGVLYNLFRELKNEEGFMTAALGLIMSGAIGNLIDRVDKQSVTDFLRFYWPSEGGIGGFLTNTFGTTEYPSFNVADMAIICGVGMFMFHYLFLEDRQGDDTDADSLAIDDSADDIGETSTEEA
jgi:signal peptidase II